MRRLLIYLKHKNKEPILWDRLLLVICGNIFIAMAIITLIQDKSVEGSLFGLSIGIIAHIHYWQGGRFIIKFDSSR